MGKEIKNRKVGKEGKNELDELGEDNIPYDIEYS